MARRDDFKKSIKDAVAKRASFICSNPECRCLTIAPADVDLQSVLYVGRVAHITAAAEGGPRYNTDLTSDQRASADNAIFLCANCADMVDDNKGTDYSEDLLRSWKTEHEEWVRAQLNLRQDTAIAMVAGEHAARGEGVVTGLSVEGPAIIQPGTRVTAEGKGEITGTRIGPRRDQ